MDMKNGYSYMLFFGLCLVLVDPCAAYSYAHSSRYWWASLAVFLMALSCCGVAFCYDRFKDIEIIRRTRRHTRRRLGHHHPHHHRHRTHITHLQERTSYPQVVRTGDMAAFNSYSNLVSLMLMTPNQPGVYLPPSYEDVSQAVPAYQPGKQSDGMSRPPSYSKIYEASGSASVFEAQAPGTSGLPKYEATPRYQIPLPPSPVFELPITGSVFPAAPTGPIRRVPSGSVFSTTSSSPVTEVPPPGGAVFRSDEENSGVIFQTTPAVQI